jgi:hypothetical protein
MRNPGPAIWAGVACALVAVGASGNSPAQAQGANARDGQRVSITQPIDATAQSRRRAATRIRVERQNSYLPPNAVRECHAWYEQEFRPSGTVIVPRMRCRWVLG